jgi:hypothetical protein
VSLSIKIIITTITILGDYMKKIFIFLFFVLSISLYSQEYKWYKGNIHTHTNHSDGDEYPERVVQWYKDHEYNFLVITDHNILTETKYLDYNGNEDNFILIAGEEVTSNYNKKPVHLNGINIKKVVPALKGNSVSETIQKNIDAILEAGGIAMLNHPRWRKAITANDVIGIKNCDLLEVYNYTKASNNFAAGGDESTEMFWDRLLSKNMKLWGVATDDTHNYIGEFSFEKANPGKGWVVVRAKELTPDAITNALKNGDFYASVGVVLKNIIITDKEYKIEIVADSMMNYTTFFIGKDGKVLKEDYSHTPSYQFKGDELYVRARVFCSSGEFAITQPYFLKK